MSATVVPIRTVMPREFNETPDGWQAEVRRELKRLDDEVFDILMEGERIRRAYEERRRRIEELRKRLFIDFEADILKGEGD